MAQAGSTPIPIAWAIPSPGATPPGMTPAPRAAGCDGPMRMRYRQRCRGHGNSVLGHGGGWRSVHRTRCLRDSCHAWIGHTRLGPCNGSGFIDERTGGCLRYSRSVGDRDHSQCGIHCCQCLWCGDGKQYSNSSRAVPRLRGGALEFGGGSCKVRLKARSRLGPRHSVEQPIRQNWARHLAQ